MTEQEAIKNINALNAVCMNKEFYDVDFYLALSLAVGALEKVQQFEAIGTVEEIKSFFNENRKAGYKHGYADGYVKVIDEFTERMFRICAERGTKICAISNAPLYAHEDGTWHSLIRDVAEQMKGGAT